MHCLDYLSDKPKFFIFKKATNKTNLGGVLFLVYIIIMILISSAYIADYIINEKYTYDALSFYNYTTKEEEENMNNDDILNPYLNISLHLYENHNIVVYDNTNSNFIQKEKIDFDGANIYNIRTRANETYLTIFYICKEQNCSSYDDLIYEDIDYFGRIEIYYANYKIDHYDEIPVQKIKDDGIIFSDYLENPYYIGFHSWTFKWEVIKYQEQKSLFDPLTKRQTEYYFGHIKNEEPKVELKSIYTNTGYYVPFFEIIINNKHKEFILYTRKKVDFLDVIASIGALFSTIKFFFLCFFIFIKKILIIINY